MLAINNMPDHLHFFIGLNPKQSISDLLRLTSPYPFLLTFTDAKCNVISQKIIKFTAIFQMKPNAISIKTLYV